jgi:23S rRNA (pseudouridine1915-N3)-methyltransferase
VKIVVRAVGKMRDRRLEELCGEYLDRAKRHLPVQVQEVADDAALRVSAGAGSEIIALDPTGEAWNTDEFTRYLEKHMVHGTRTLVFLIGGAEGLSDATRAVATRKLSLSMLTLPHRLARVMLCEQIYRCISRIRGEPYDK